MLNINEHYREYLGALLNGQHGKCRRIVQGMLDQEISIPDLYTNLFQRALYDVGELWEHHKISVAVEHLATSITESLMALVYPTLFDRLPSQRSAIVSCAANEYHQIGGRMVADILEMHGWDGYFLGANTPIQELVRLADEKKPDLIALSLSVYFGMPELLRSVEVIRVELGDIPVIVGGQAFRWGGIENLPARHQVEYIADLPGLEKIATEGQ